MRHALIATLIIILSNNLFSQTTRKKPLENVWTDTTFKSVQLKDLSETNKIIRVDIGKKAIILLSLKDLQLEAETYLKNEQFHKSFEKLNNYFDSVSQHTDTIRLTEYRSFQHLEYLISHLLTTGYAKVFYKRSHAFVDTIFHRSERYGSNADRFFYLPDKRPFFAVREYSGILDKEGDPLQTSHLNTYMKEGEKLQSLRDE